MTSPLLRSGLPLAFVAFAATACLTPNTPTPTRWFAPPVAPVSIHDDAPAAAVRLARVTGAAHLGTPMVWRLSDVEVAIDEVNRWVDDPAAIVQRALEQRLFGSGQFVEGGSAARALHVYVDAFEALLDDAPRARVGFQLTLTDPQGGAALRTSVVTEQPLASTSAEDVARTIGAALATATERTSGWCAQPSR